MGEYTGLTPESYAALTDRYILWVLFDKKGRVVPERKAGKARRRREPESEEPPPTAQDLGIPEEAYRYADHAGRTPPACYVMAYWQAWRARGLAPGAVMARWREKMAACGRKLGGSGVSPATMTEATGGQTT
jgi:hypothetical protein